MKFAVVVGLVAMLALTGCAVAEAGPGTPFIQVSSTLSQPVSAEPTQALIDTIDADQGMIVIGNNIEVPHHGVYFVVFAPQVGNNGDDIAHFQAWIRVNGEDVANSNVLLALDGNTTKDVIVSQMAVPLAAGDQVSFWMQADKSGVGIEAIDASPNPLVPAHISTVFLVD